LLLDIIRIQKEKNIVGDLFDDELVEQVSCSALNSICLDHQQTLVNLVLSCMCVMHACINDCSCLRFSSVPIHNSQHYEALVRTLKQPSERD
jgi:hypothetical protein